MEDEDPWDFMLREFLVSGSQLDLKNKVSYLESLNILI